MQKLLTEISKCRLCQKNMVHEPRPVVTASTLSRIAIVGQAPGRKVHHSGIPWDDPSGDRLRKWMNIEKTDFYNADLFALIPMAFCYPGKGNSGDLPPSPVCAPTWHKVLFNQIYDVKLKLLVGSYAQKYYLENQAKSNLTENVKNYYQFLPDYLPLPHPSPRNIAWFIKNSWFDREVIPKLRLMIKDIIGA